MAAKMNARVYREARIKVTPEIKKCVIELMDAEDDTSAKKKHPAKWYRAEVAKALKLTDETITSLRSFEVMIDNLRTNFKVVNPLEAEWHLGTLKDYPLSPLGIAKLFEFKLKANEAERNYVTIRQALWMDKLSALPISPYMLSKIASHYSIQEKMCDLVGDNSALSPEHDEEALLRLLREYPDEMATKDFSTKRTPEQDKNTMRKLAEYMVDNSEKTLRILKESKKGR